MAVSGGRVMRCPSCAGRAADGEALSHVVGPTESLVLAGVADAKGDVACPSCRAAMAEGRRAGVVVDRCDACSVVWFDAGELDAFRESLEFHEARRQTRPGSGSPWARILEWINWLP